MSVVKLDRLEKKKKQPRNKFKSSLITGKSVTMKVNFITLFKKTRRLKVYPLSEFFEVFE